MNLIILMYMGTVLSSFCIHVNSKFKFFKYILDLGYKVNDKKIDQFKKIVNKYITDIDYFTMIIPIYNVIKFVKKRRKYIAEISMLLNKMIILNIIEKMDEYEAEKYFQKSTWLRTMLMVRKVLSNSKELDLVKIDIDNTNGYKNIHYNFNNSNVYFEKLDEISYEKAEQEQTSQIMESLNISQKRQELEDSRQKLEQNILMGISKDVEHKKSIFVRRKKKK